MSDPLDNQGNPIKVGDDIVWATRRGNSGCINVGTVYAINESQILATRKGGKKVALDHPQRIVVMPKVAPEFPLDILAPGTENDYKPYVIPSNGRIPDNAMKAGEFTDENSGQQRP
jgi:hypothetical protein